MNRVEVVFAAIDVLFHPLQNYIKVDGITVEKDISYGKSPENQMDFYYKKTDETLPVLVNIHGGGFVKGDKKHRASLSLLYADRGWFVVNINYRLSPKSVFPTVVEDVLNVLNKLPELKDKYNLNLDKVVLTGDSSGAYTSAMTAACIFDPELLTALSLPQCDIVPAGVVGFCGLYDVVEVLKKPFPFKMSRVLGTSITGVTLGRKLKGLDEYKHINHISPIDYINEKWCPVFVAYSKKDMFCSGQGEAFCEKLKEKGVPYDESYSTSILDNHCYHFNFWTKASKNTMSKVYAFLEDIKNK
ncbi:MAG: alpha/beta hydrolase [Clostridia bacterium]